MKQQIKSQIALIYVLTKIMSFWYSRYLFKTYFTFVVINVDICQGLQVLLCISRMVLQHSCQVQVDFASDIVICHTKHASNLLCSVTRLPVTFKCIWHICSNINSEEYSFNHILALMLKILYLPSLLKFRGLDARDMEVHIPPSHKPATTFNNVYLLATNKRCPLLHWSFACLG